MMSKGKQEVFWVARQEAAKGILELDRYRRLYDPDEMVAKNACLGAADEAEDHAFLFAIAGLEKEALEAFKGARALGQKALEIGDRWVFRTPGEEGFAAYVAHSVIANAEWVLGGAQLIGVRLAAASCLDEAVRRAGRKRRPEDVARLALAWAIAGRWDRVEAAGRQMRTGVLFRSRLWRDLTALLAATAGCAGEAGPELEDRWRKQVREWLLVRPGERGIPPELEYAEMANILDVAGRAIRRAIEPMKVIRMIRHPEAFLADRR